MSARTVDLLNIGLMLGSLALAFALPFELFLFSYAVLGPLHYLTEIAWLRERRFFMHGRLDWLPIGILALLVLLGQRFVLGGASVALFERYGSQLIFAAFALAAILTACRTTSSRAVGAIVLGTFMLVFADVGARGWMLFALFVSTLVHVSLFTGAFMLFGALKGRSTTGYLACAALAVCSLVALFAPAQAHDLAGEYVRASYRVFASMNVELARLIGANGGGAQPFPTYETLFTTSAGIAVQRFIAFAYTYHYLNWFSKTSIIRWHAVDRRKLAAAVVIWLASLGLYAADYELGARWLFLLSMAHVLLEFPLNHVAFAGIGRELALRVRGRESAAARE